MIRLICMDLDGVLIPRQNFWLELHKAFGTTEQGAMLAKRHAGDNTRLVQEIVATLWKGRDAAPYERLVDATPTMPGIEALFIELDRFVDIRGEGVPRVIIGGGSYDVATRIAKRFGVGFIFANQLIVKDGKVTGEFHWPVGGSYTKRRIIEQLCDDFDILPQDVLMIGDSDGDIDAFRIVGTSIAFNCASDALKDIATYAVESQDLRDIVPVLERIRAAQPAMGADSPKI